jgi:hypothetical protein
MRSLERVGSATSKKWVGKFDPTPPSVNQQRSGLSPRWGFLRQSIAYRGMALNRIGKLRLILAATTTGRSSGSGQHLKPRKSTSSKRLSGGP